MNLCMTPDSTSNSATTTEDGRLTHDALVHSSCDMAMQYVKYIPHAPRHKVTPTAVASRKDAVVEATATRVTDSPKPRRETHCGTTMVDRTSLDDVRLSERPRSNTYTPGCSIETAKEKLYKSSTNIRHHMRDRPDTIQHRGRRFRFVTGSARRKHEDRLDSMTSLEESTDTDNFTSVETADGEIYLIEQGDFVPCPPDRVPHRKSGMITPVRERTANHPQTMSPIDDCGSPAVVRSIRPQPPIIDITAPSPSASSQHSSIVHPRKGFLSLRYMSGDAGQSSGICMILLAHADKILCVMFALLTSVRRDQ